jgi:hypothetical protein
MVAVARGARRGQAAKDKEVTRGLRAVSGAWLR